MIISGNVGIGTTTPGTLLSLGTTGGINFALGTSTFGASANGINITNGCFAVNGVCAGTGNGTVNAGTAGQVPYYKSAGSALTATSTLFIATNGNVGINTPSPSTGLQITAPYIDTLDAGLRITTGDANLTPGLSIDSGSSISSLRNFAILANYNNAGNLGINYSSSAGGNPNTNALTIDGSDGNIGVGYSTLGTGKLEVNGNLGVGVINPTKALDVAGSANLSTGNAYYINGTSVLNGTTLGSGITASSLTSVGTLTSLTVSGLLTASNGFTLSSGTLTLPSASIADSALSSNVALLNRASQTFSGALNVFQNASTTQLTTTGSTSLATLVATSASGRRRLEHIII